MARDVTTIEVARVTRRDLGVLARHGETMDSIIRRLLRHGASAVRSENEQLGLAALEGADDSFRAHA